MARLKVSNVGPILFDRVFLGRREQCSIAVHYPEDGAMVGNNRFGHIATPHAGFLGFRVGGVLIVRAEFPMDQTILGLESLNRRSSLLSRSKR